MKRGNAVTLVVLAALGAFLLWSTLSSQRQECTVTVAFKGRTNTATASAASEGEAAHQAQVTACGTIAQGMDETIACGRVEPVRRTCRSL